MEEDRASRSRVSIVCGRAEREEQGGEYRRMAEQARGKIRNVRRRKRSSHDSVHVRNVRSFCALWYTRLSCIPHDIPHDAICCETPRYSSNRRTRNLSLSFESHFFLLLAKIFSDDIALVYFARVTRIYVERCKKLLHRNFLFLTVTHQIRTGGIIYFFYLYIKIIYKTKSLYTQCKYEFLINK